MTDRRIHPFRVVGEAKDQEWIYKNMGMVEDLLIDTMNGGGYLPVLDIAPHWMHSFDSDKEDFKYQVTIHGVYVGKRKARENECVDGGTIVGRAELQSGSGKDRIDKYWSGSSWSEVDGTEL